MLNQNDPLWQKLPLNPKKLYEIRTSVYLYYGPYTIVHSKIDSFDSFIYLHPASYLLWYLNNFVFLHFFLILQEETQFPFIYSQKVIHSKAHCLWAREAFYDWKNVWTVRVHKINGKPLLPLGRIVSISSACVERGLWNLFTFEEVEGMNIIGI